MLNQLGVLLFLLSRIQSKHIQVSLCSAPAVGHQGKEGDGECAVTAHAPMLHWQTMKDRPVDMQFCFYIFSLKSSFSHSFFP